jgi:pyrimidine-nucleoside phosphorylase
MAAWMMAVYLRGMTDAETAELTDVMAHSGVMVDLSPIPGIKVDKHSTGGVGDKTTLVIAPIVAACGVKIAKMSGRGLGHTGGTIDKMESVPGTKTALSQEEFFAQVNKIGLSVIGQSEGIAVADKKMYALRDVTATVSCIPLIASSIMSKKLASGSDAILLDVTTGTGAFMKTVDQSIELAKLMVSIGTHHGRRVAAMITDMDTPLGHNIGNQFSGLRGLCSLDRESAAVCAALAQRGNQFVEHVAGSVWLLVVVSAGFSLSTSPRWMRAHTCLMACRYCSGVMCSRSSSYRSSMSRTRCMPAPSKPMRPVRL